MNRPLVIGFALLLAACFAAPVYSPAQSPARPASRDGRAQSGSHQMNQPGPELPPKRELSQDRIDEISGLYAAAKKELEAKAKAAGGPPKK